MPAVLKHLSLWNQKESQSPTSTDSRSPVQNGRGPTLATSGVFVGLRSFQEQPLGSADLYYKKTIKLRSAERPRQLVGEGLTVGCALPELPSVAAADGWTSNAFPRSQGQEIAPVGRRTRGSCLWHSAAAAVLRLVKVNFPHLRRQCTSREVPHFC